MPSKPPTKNTALRIIGGKWRGRKLTIPVRPGLRPTHDRVRETLFNWLQPVITDSRCLDAFAGSGALGFEALSRGAAQAIFVENDRMQAQAIEKNATELQSIHAHVIQSTWPGVKLSDEKLDVVFLDPPFHSGLIDVVWNELISQQLLTNTAWVYIEHAADEKPTIPDGFHCHREKQTKQVVYGLFRRL
jgi:16S rRNA (guanine966-N2)-methyltransferase